MIFTSGQGFERPLLVVFLKFSAEDSSDCLTLSEDTSVMCGKSDL
jgi:hypothetical protein